MHPVDDWRGGNKRWKFFWSPRVADSVQLVPTGMGWLKIQESQWNRNAVKAAEEHQTVCCCPTRSTCPLEMTRGAKIALFQPLLSVKPECVFLCGGCMSISGGGLVRYISHLLWSIFTEGDFSTSLSLIRLPRYTGLNVSVYSLMCFCYCSSNDK